MIGINEIGVESPVIQIQYDTEDVLTRIVTNEDGKAVASSDVYGNISFVDLGSMQSVRDFYDSVVTEVMNTDLILENGTYKTLNQVFEELWGLTFMDDGGGSIENIPLYQLPWRG